jgi:hypothetical protein
VIGVLQVEVFFNGINADLVTFAQCQEEDRRRNAMLMIRKAMNGEANTNAPVDELRSINDEIVDNIGSAEENRSESERRCAALAGQRRQRKEKHNEATKECRLVRRHYLRVHDGGVQAQSALIPRSTQRIVGKVWREVVMITC